jgi:phage terminase large subunit-like protein
LPKQRLVALADVSPRQASPHAPAPAAIAPAVTAIEHADWIVPEIDSKRIGDEMVYSRIAPALRVTLSIHEQALPWH